MNDVRNVLSRFPEPYKESVSRRCNVKEGTVGQWETRGSVPHKHRPELIGYAAELGLVDITYEKLEKISTKQEQAP